MQRRSQVQTIVHQYLRLAYADLVIYFSSSKIPSATVHGFRLCCYAAETLLNPPTRLPLPLPPSCPATAGTATLGPSLAAPLFPLSSIKSNKVLDFLQESCGFGIPDLGNRARANTTIDSSLAAIYEGLNDSCCVIEEIVGTAALGCYAAEAQELASSSGPELAAAFLKTVQENRDLDQPEILIIDNDEEERAEIGGQTLPAVVEKQENEDEDDGLKLERILRAAYVDTLIPTEISMRHNTTIYYRTSGASSSSAAAPSPNSDLIGVVQIFDESSRIVMKCNCKVHKSCTCFLNLPLTLSIDDLKQSMVTWLETARSLPARAHRYHSEVIRMSYGIQPRKPDGLSGKCAT